MSVVADDLRVQRAAGALLTARFNAYLAAVELDAGISGTPRPKGDVSFNRLIQTGNGSRVPPYLVVSAPGDESPPAKVGGRYHSRIRLGVCAVVGGRDYDETDLRAKLYAAALRDCLLDHPALGGLAIACDWTGRRYDVLDADRTRTIAATEVLFSVDVRDASDLRREPLADDGTPIPWPVVERTRVEVVPRPARTA